jgi:hypothetical protein
MCEVVVDQPETGSSRPGQHPALVVFLEPQITVADHEHRCINHDHHHVRKHTFTACR